MQKRTCRRGGKQGGRTGGKYGGKQGGRKSHKTCKARRGGGQTYSDGFKFF